MSTFTPSQTAAIENSDQNNLVVAGAGSGKTRVLTYRVARLVADGCNPASILVLTFTRKAARELKERLTALIGEAAKRVWVGTFHGVSYRILSQWGSEIGYKTGGLGDSISIVPPDEAEEIMDSVCQSYRWRGTKKQISDARAVLAHNGTFPADPDLGRIIREYWSILKENNALDYDQILLETHRLFQECPRALEHYRTKFSHIFVDEYQDTDRVQYDLHERISPKNLFAVGDLKQAIYGWRGADIEIIRGFEVNHPGTRVTYLSECFRCGRVIVQAANALIAHNVSTLEKPMIAALDLQGEIVYKRGGGDQIAEYLDGLFEPHGSIAVIGRTHHALDGVERAFVGAGIPFHRVGAASQSVESMPAWKRFHGVLRSATNINDSIAFIAHASKAEGLTDEQMSRLRKGAVEAGESLSFYFYRQLEHKIHPIVGKGLLLWMSDFQAIETSVSELWACYCDRLSMSGDDVDRITKHLEQYGEGKDADEWLEWLGTRDMHSELESAPKDRITLLTAHASKGLEWDTVIIVDFDDSVFPSQVAIKRGDPEEERRLAYVAFTRAKKRLVIFSRKQPSRFLCEAGIFGGTKEQ